MRDLIQKFHCEDDQFWKKEKIVDKQLPCSFVLPTVNKAPFSLIFMRFYFVYLSKSRQSILHNRCRLLHNWIERYKWATSTQIHLFLDRLLGGVDLLEELRCGGWAGRRTRASLQGATANFEVLASFKTGLDWSHLQSLAGLIPWSLCPVRHQTSWSPTSCCDPCGRRSLRN